MRAKVITRSTLARDAARSRTDEDHVGTRKVGLSIALTFPAVDMVVRTSSACAADALSIHA